MRTKESFHKLIDTIEDKRALESYYKLIKKLNTAQTGELWKNLNKEEKKELLLSYEESFDADNLISHEVVKKQHKKWLKK
jgi:hypothetical protein